MTWLQNQSDTDRREGLARLEDRRVAFANQLASDGLSFKQALLVQKGGGFEGIGLHNGDVYLLTGPAPIDAQGQFTCERLVDVSCRFEPHAIESEGMGGMLGMGKKGGHGYMLKLDWAEGNLEIECVPALQAMLDVREGDDFPLLNTQRSKRSYNFVWDFKVIDQDAVNRIAQRWTALLPCKE